MGRIYSFFGAHGGCGLSQTVLSLGLSLGGKVLLVHAEEALGDEYLTSVRISFGELLPYLDGCLLDPSDVAGRAYYKKGLSVIGGANRAASGRVYAPGDVGIFLKKMAARYDAVLCDCGCDVGSGLSFGAMAAADKRFMVLSENENCLRRYLLLEPLFEKQDLDICGYILCRLSDVLATGKNYAAKRLSLDAEKIYELPFSSFGAEAEFLGKALCESRDRRYRKSIEELKEKIIGKEEF